MIPAGRLSAQALHVLDLAADALGSAAPARRYPAAGTETDPAWDDEQLTVSITQGSITDGITGTPGRRQTPTPAGNIPMLELRVVIEVVLCTPTSDDDGNAVDATILTGHATTMFAAGTALWNVVEQAAKDGSLAVDGATLGGFRTEALRFVGPSGNYSAARHAFTMILL